MNTLYGSNAEANVVLKSETVITAASEVIQLNVLLLRANSAATVNHYSVSTIKQIKC
jgi:hypothetical protein